MPCHLPFITKTLAIKPLIINLNLRILPKHRRFPMYIPRLSTEPLYTGFATNHQLDLPQQALTGLLQISGVSSRHLQPSSQDPEKLRRSAKPTPIESTI